MKTNTLIRNAALVLALTAGGSAMAADTPATPVLDRETVRAQHRAETANMTAEERAAYRAQKQAEMTPEQRAEMRAANAGSANGKGIKARDGSATGSRRGAPGAPGAAAGAGTRGR